MTRPPAVLLAVVLLALEGVDGLGFDLLLVGLAGELLGEIQPFGVLLLASAVVFGAGALGAAVGAWSRRTWSWPVGAVLEALVMLGVIVAGVSGGWHPALFAGVILGGLGMVALFSRETRRALGV